MWQNHFSSDLYNLPHRLNPEDLGKWTYWGA